MAVDRLGAVLHNNGSPDGDGLVNYRSTGQGLVPSPAFTRLRFDEGITAPRWMFQNEREEPPVGPSPEVADILGLGPIVRVNVRAFVDLATTRPDASFRIAVPGSDFDVTPETTEIVPQPAGWPYPVSPFRHQTTGNTGTLIAPANSNRLVLRPLQRYAAPGPIRPFGTTGPVVDWLLSENNQWNEPPYAYVYSVVDIINSPEGPSEQRYTAVLLIGSASDVSKAPPLRQYPRHDTVRGVARLGPGASRSRQGSLRQGWAGTYL